MRPYIDHPKDSIQWCLDIGMTIKATNGSDVHIPFTLKPTRFPEEKYKQALQLQGLFHELVYNMVQEREFILDIVNKYVSQKNSQVELIRRLSAHDDFVRRLGEIFKQTHSPKIFFSINRSDYMLHHDEEDGDHMFQVEMNTISVAFPAFSSKIFELHDSAGFDSVLPNYALKHVGFSIHLALLEYSPYCRNMIMIVQEGERNVQDQELLCLEIHRRYNIFIRMATLGEVKLHGSLKDDGSLWYNGDEIGLVYYRAGYGPADYKGEDEWAARLMIEKSRAIKCPDVGAHLAGLKKVQQVIVDPKVLGKFLSPDEVTRVSTCFTGLFALDEEDPKTCKVIAEAIAHPHKYVLKPQREGGGNNLYGEEMVKVLKAASNPSDLAPYILMTLITPKARPNSLVKESLVYDCDTVSELGIYGTYLVGSDGQAKLNVPAGYLLRTKAVGVLEGGVASGFSVLDSLQLI